MLSDRQLERASRSYRRGYRDGYAGRQATGADNGIAAINDDTIGGMIRPFADYDYKTGYEAGANDKRCETRLSANRDFGGAFDGVRVSSDADEGL